MEWNGMEWKAGRQAVKEGDRGEGRNWPRQDPTYVQEDPSYVEIKGWKGKGDRQDRARTEQDRDRTRAE